MSYQQDATIHDGLHSFQTFHATLPLLQQPHFSAFNALSMLSCLIVGHPHGYLLVYRALSLIKCISGDALPDAIVREHELVAIPRLTPFRFV